MSVLVAVGQRDDGDGVDGLHQRSLRQGLGHHLAAKVRHCVPVGRQKQESVSQQQQQQRVAPGFMTRKKRATDSPNCSQSLPNDTIIITPFYIDSGTFSYES